MEGGVASDERAARYSRCPEHHRDCGAFKPLDSGFRVWGSRYRVEGSDVYPSQLNPDPQGWWGWGAVAEHRAAAAGREGRQRAQEGVRSAVKWWMVQGSSLRSEGILSPL